MSNRALSTYVQSNITTYVGHRTTLPCFTYSNIPIRAVEWTRRDKPRKYVLLSRDGHLDAGNQHPSFKNRAKLKDRKMKDGDLSMNLEDIEPSDTGIYECRFKGSETRRRKRGVLSDDPISVVNLTVDKIQYITARSGQNVLLPCRVPRDTKVDALEWTRSDLESKGYIFLLRDGIPDTTNQHPSFQNRVELRHSLLDDGNLSLIVKNVSSSDSGRYECRVKESGMKRWKKAAIKIEPVSIIVLMVTTLALTNEDTEDEEEDEDEDTDKKNSDVKIPTERGTHKHYGVIAGIAGFALIYVFWGIMICFKLL